VQRVAAAAPAGIAAAGIAVAGEFFFAVVAVIARQCAARARNPAWDLVRAAQPIMCFLP
jgi:hypothetical protein